VSKYELAYLFPLMEDIEPQVLRT